MPAIQSPQSQAGIMSFYDAKTTGPKFDPKLTLAIIAIFVVIIVVVNHFVAA